VKTVLLLRHAKSAWDSPGLSDHDRPLNRRGEKAARGMAEYLVAQGPQPDLILCSTAVRARQTLAPLVDLLTPAPPISLEKGLYLASEDVLLARLRDLPPEVGTVLLIGHNDGIWQLAEVLAGHGKTNSLAALREKYPTGTLACLAAPTPRWPDLAVGSAELLAFVRPRDLMASA
jgi:phosphohistidine phosphatase